jgi:hypothetical protein
MPVDPLDDTNLEGAPFGLGPGQTLIVLQNTCSFGEICNPILIGPACTHSCGRGSAFTLVGLLPEALNGRALGRARSANAAILAKLAGWLLPIRRNSSFSRPPALLLTFSKSPIALHLETPTLAKLGVDEAH